MGKQPTGTRKNNNRPRVYGRIPNKPRKMKIHIPTPPPSPPRPPTAMNTVNNAEFANTFSKMKVSKGRTITLQPTRMSQSPTRKSTRIKFKPGHREEKLKMDIKKTAKRGNEMRQTRRKKREDMKALNILLGNTKIGSNSTGSKSTRRKSTRSKSTRRKSTRKNSKRR